MYPNSALAAWQLALMAVVIAASLTVWIAAVYLADRSQTRSARLAHEAGTDVLAGPGAADAPSQAEDQEGRLAA